MQLEHQEQRRTQSHRLRLKAAKLRLLDLQVQLRLLGLERANFPMAFLRYQSTLESVRLGLEPESEVNLLRCLNLYSLSRPNVVRQSSTVCCSLTVAPLIGIERRSDCLRNAHCVIQIILLSISMIPILNNKSSLCRTEKDAASIAPNRTICYERRICEKL